MRRTWRPGSSRGVRREAEDSGWAERGQDSPRYLGVSDAADRKSWEVRTVSGAPG